MICRRCYTAPESHFYWFAHSAVTTFLTTRTSCLVLVVSGTSHSFLNISGLLRLGGVCAHPCAYHFFSMILRTQHNFTLPWWLALFRIRHIGTIWAYHRILPMNIQLYSSYRYGQCPTIFSSCPSYNNLAYKNLCFVRIHYSCNTVTTRPNSNKKENVQKHSFSELA